MSIHIHNTLLSLSSTEAHATLPDMTGPHKMSVSSLTILCCVVEQHCTGTGILPLDIPPPTPLPLGPGYNHLNINKLLSV